MDDAEGVKQTPNMECGRFQEEQFKHPEKKLEIKREKKHEES